SQERRSRGAPRGPRHAGDGAWTKRYRVLTRSQGSLPGERRRNTAVDGDHAAGGGTRAIREQEGDRLGDVDRLHLAAEQTALGVESLELLRSDSVGLGPLSPHLVGE